MHIQSVSNAQQIIAVIHSAFQRYEADPMPSSALAETSETIEQNLSDGIEILGVTINTELVGVIKLARQHSSLYFSRLSVLPQHQRKGIASALIRYVEEMALQEHFNYVSCKVRKTENDNIRLYQKLGYQIIKEELSTSPTGFTMETVTMKKVIH